MTTVLVIGAGWLGQAIANASAARGASVWSMRRSAPSTELHPRAVAGVHFVQGDITAAIDDAGLDALLASLEPMHAHNVRPPGSLADVADAPVHVVLCVSPSRSRGDSYGSLYPDAARGAARLAVALRARTLVYTSSTGVYGVSDGSWVAESREIHPRDDRERALFDAEQAVLLHASDAPRGESTGTVSPAGTGRIVLRVAGLYGPGRDPAPRFATLEQLEQDGRFWCNFAWRDDVVSAVALMQENSAFHVGGHVFNCADGQPALARDIARSLGDVGAYPAYAGTDSRSAPPAGRQRIAVDRLRATGWTPTVPDVYAGLALLGHRVAVA